MLLYIYEYIHRSYEKAQIDMYVFAKSVSMSTTKNGRAAVCIEMHMRALALALEGRTVGILYTTNNTTTVMLVLVGG